MTKQEALAEQSRLTAVYAEARSVAASNPTPENRGQAVAASTNLSSFMAANGLLPKSRGYSSRAGAFQAAQRKAELQEAPRHQRRK